MDKKLFEPLEIKGMRLKNRIGSAPFLTIPVGPDCSVTDLTIRWYEELAKGGTALIVATSIIWSEADRENRSLSETETLYYSIYGRMAINLQDDKYVEGVANLCEAVHSHGARLGLQIVVLGTMAGRGASPSPYPDAHSLKETRESLTMGGARPVREVSVEEIEWYEEEMASVAARAKEAGVDCVELHCGHGGATLYGNFISPYYNRRTDKYGGDWEGRLRFPVETAHKMRAAVGEDYPILVRISADEWLGERGVVIDDATNFIVPALDKAGVDCIDVSQGSVTHSPDGVTLPLYYPRGCVIHYAAAVKKATNLPVIGVGRILDLDMAERFLQEQKADIIYLGKQLVADPETPNKYFEGSPEDIRKCLGCAGGCGRPCTINYDFQDTPISLTPADKLKSVLVVGGGVAGMEAARIAALRGHKVTLFEKEPELGGMVAALGLTPMTAEFQNIVDYLVAQLIKLKVDVRVCKEATPEEIEGLKTDVVILSTGSSTVLPEVARDKLGVLTHKQALKRKREIGNKVVIWGLFGVELAIALAEEGKDVILMGRGKESSLGSDISDLRKWIIWRKLTDINFARGGLAEPARLNNPKVLYDVEIEDITINGIVVKTDTKGTMFLAYDTLIISQRFGERRCNDSLYDALKEKVSEIYKIGDCSKVKTIQEAIFSANEVARKI